MIDKNKVHLHRLLRWSERYTKTDMVYFASGNLWLILGRIATSGSGFFLTLGFANLLTPEAFGSYKYILAVAGFIGAFSLNGLGNAALRAIGKGQIDVIPSLFRASMLWSIPASFVALGIGGYYLFMGNATLGWALIVIAVLNPLLSNLAITKSFFIANGDFKRTTLYNTISTLIQIAVIIFSLLLTKNVLFIASTYFIINAIVGYTTYLLSMRALHVKDDPTHLRETIAYTKHLSVLGIFQTVIGQLDQLLLWHFAGPVALATYAIALGPIRELRTLSTNITSLAFPKIAEKTKGDAAHAIRDKSKKILVVYTLITALYIFIAPHAFHFLFPRYMSAVLPSQILALSLIFQSLSLADLFLFIHGEIKDRYRIIVPSQSARAVLYLILIPLYGLYGAALAVLLAECANLLATAYAYKTNRRS